MKNSLQEHIELIFHSLNIDSGFEIYDCLNDELPKWASGLSHSFQYLICSAAIDNIDRIKLFIGKDICECNGFLYWYDGEPVEPIIKEPNITPFGIPLESEEVGISLKTNTRLPSWLDDFIFNTLNAQYAPNHERFDFNLDLSESDVLKYLGTYFPRSYGEAFCIFDNLFQNKGFYSYYNQSETAVNIAVIGCGTGGDLLGLLTVIAKYAIRKRDINIVAVDGNTEALQIFERIIDRFNKLNKSNVSLRIITHTFENLNDFDVMSIGPAKSFDFVMSSKMISELIASGEGSNDNSYYDFVKNFLHLIKDTGVFYLLDVTTRQKHSTFNPFLMNQQINSAMGEMTSYKIFSPIPCAIYNGRCTQSCFYQKVFTINHSRVIYDKSKVAYKLITSSEFANILGCPAEGGVYQIHNDKVCPNSEGSKGGLFDAFYIEVGGDVVVNPRLIALGASLGDHKEESPLDDIKSIPSIEDEVALNVLGAAEDLSVDVEETDGDDKDEYYTGCYVIDTNVFLDKPDIISKITSDYFVVLSAKVIDELDHLKIKKNMSPARKKRVTKALKNISQSMNEREIVMEDSDTRLLPRDFDKNCPDNKILSVALKFMDENPILLTSDYGLQVRARGLGIKSISLKNFVKTVINID